jgi:hypothetical protein
MVLAIGHKRHGMGDRRSSNRPLRVEAVADLDAKRSQAPRSAPTRRRWAPCGQTAGLRPFHPSKVRNTGRTGSAGLRIGDDHPLIGSAVGSISSRRRSTSSICVAAAMIAEARIVLLPGSPPARLDHR